MLLNWTTEHKNIGSVAWGDVRQYEQRGRKMKSKNMSENHCRRRGMIATIAKTSTDHDN